MFRNQLLVELQVTDLKPSQQPYLYRWHLIMYQRLGCQQPASFLAVGIGSISQRYPLYILRKQPTLIFIHHTQMQILYVQSNHLQQESLDHILCWQVIQNQ